MTSTSPAPRLLPGERAFPPRLIGFAALSLLAHGASFLLFQVVYPPRVTIPPAPTQVMLLTGADAEQQSLLHWIEGEDPALVAASSHPVPEHLFDQPYRPSYLTLRTPPRSMPEVREAPEPAPGPGLAALLRQIAPKSPVRTTTLPPSPTRLLLSGGLRDRPIVAPGEFRPAIPGPLEEARLLLGVAPTGEVLFAFLQKSSGHLPTDSAALAAASRMRFASTPTETSTVWGFADITWGDEQKGDAAPSSP